MAKIFNLTDILNMVSRFSQRVYTAPGNTIRDIQPTSWPSAGQPVKPIGPPGSQPLASQFWNGQNFTYTPRVDARYTAKELQQLARYPLAAVCMENTKDQVCQLPWKIQLRQRQGETLNDVKERRRHARGDENIAKISRMLEYPDGHNDWQDWLRPILSDMLVTDSAAVELMRDRGERIIGVGYLPGHTIARYVDDTGRTPLAPSPAYAQLYQGIPRVNLTVDQLVYRPRNIVPIDDIISTYLYGFSPTEQLADWIKIGIARLLYVKEFYDHGSLGNVIQIVPNEVGPAQIKTAMDWTNNLLSGQLSQRRMWTMLQGFQQEGKPDQILIPKEPSMSDNYDDLHIRYICFGYGTSPQRLQRMMNRGSAAASQEAAQEEGIKPWVRWAQAKLNYIIQVKMGFYDYALEFDLYQDLDVVKQSKADASDVDHGIISPNTARTNRGDDPDPDPNADRLWFKSPTGYIPMSDAHVAYQQNGSGGGKATDSSVIKPPVKPNGKANGVSLIHRGEM